ncbi:MAG: M48 family metallopeptidase [Burkholderiales bacterium]|nr:M48 family metallopeptidase [Burkholderiales bacterium]
MTEYSNPRIPDGINVSHTHPLADFARLLGGILVVVAVAVGALALLAGYLAKYVPFESERAIAERFVGSLAQPGPEPVAAYLDALTQRIAAAHDLPPGMKITVHYVPGDTVNAFATLGGHIAIYEGLMRKMPNENALAMVISHEIAHVRQRHPISSMGRVLVIGVALTAVSATAGGDVVGQVLGPAGLLTMMSFSRDQERAADAEALDALVKVYGHAGGAADTFRTLQQATAGKARPPELFSTHPLDADRIAAIESTVAERGWATSGELAAYPAAVAAALAAAGKNDESR